MIVNVDAGEGEAGNAKDLAFLDHVDALNLALGGHAGDPGWTRELATIAMDRGLRVHLHPGVPDRASFGRVMPAAMSWPDLARSLAQQRAVLPGVSCCKFHGALYNCSTVDRVVAERLVQWSLDEGLEELLVFPGGELEKVAQAAGLRVLREAFADRAYCRHDGNKNLVLAQRGVSGAVLDEVESALDQARNILGRGSVKLLDGGEAVIACETLCLHGDGEVAVELAARLRKEVVG